MLQIWDKDSSLTVPFEVDVVVLAYFECRGVHLSNFVVGGWLNSCRELPTYPRRGIKSQRSSIFFPRDRVVYSVVSVRVHVYSELERRLGMWLDIFKACEVAGSGAFLTSFDSFDSFLSREFQALVIGWGNCLHAVQPRSSEDCVERVWTIYHDELDDFLDFSDGYGELVWSEGVSSFSCESD